MFDNYTIENKIGLLEKSFEDVEISEEDKINFSDEE